MSRKRSLANSYTSGDSVPLPCKVSVAHFQMQSPSGDASVAQSSRGHTHQELVSSSSQVAAGVEYEELAGIAAALSHGADHVLVGLGASPTNANKGLAASAAESGLIGNVDQSPDLTSAFWRFLLK